MDDYDRDDEEKSERLDRNWNELLQELRVSQTAGDKLAIARASRR